MLRTQLGHALRHVVAQRLSEALVELVRVVVEAALDVLAGRARGGDPRQRIDVLPGFIVVRGQ
jgi:hypothetical protein